MGYVAPTWQNGGPPALNAKNMQDISDNLAYVSNNMVNPNLLDNWYFGNPVNQREGRIVPAGTPYFVPGSSTQAGVLSSPATVIGYLDSGGKYPQVKVGGETYITQIGTDIPGYVGAGYIIDRWKLDIGESVTIDNGLNITKANSYFGQYFDDFDKYIGMQMAGSVLMSDGGLYTGTFVYNGVPDQGQTFFTNSRLGMYIQKLSTGLTQVEINSNADNVKVRAVKLELGSQQTLAHQDANGVWVLNEIPDYGEQLRKCQRYYYRLYGTTQLFALTAPAFCSTGGTVYISVALPVPMRALPVVSVHNTTLELFGGGTKYIKTLDGGLQHYACENSTDIILAMTNSTDASGVTIPTNTVLTASAETIDFAFDANL